MDKAKPFSIPKRKVWEAFKRVKANQGAAGVDGQSILEFEADLSNNLYRLWNRGHWAFQRWLIALPRKLPAVRTPPST